MTIKHLVIAGGGPSVFVMFGVLKTLHEKGVWNINNIQSIYGSSSGAMLGIFLALMKCGLTMEDIEDYMFKRSWKQLLEKEIYDFPTAFSKKGFYDLNMSKKCLEPMFKACNISVEITMKELFDLTNIKNCMFTVNINQIPLEKLGVSYQNYPDMEVYRVMLMSMGLPGLVVPTFMEDKCFVDGGLIVNFPFVDCKEAECAETHELLGVRIKWENRSLQFNQDGNLLEYFGHLTRLMYLHIDNFECKLPENHYIISCSTPHLGGPAEWLDILSDNEVRYKYLNSGIQGAAEFIENHPELSSQTQQE